MTQQIIHPMAGWPRLRAADWSDTRDTLHLWIQIVGKIRLSLTPMVNHWWQVPLYVTPRGLTTSAVPYGTGAFDIEFDFIDHRLHLRSDSGEVRHVRLEPKTVALFHEETLGALQDIGVETIIQSHPNEVEPAIPFAEDDRHASYDARAAHLFWRQLLQANRVMGEFRSRFVGKVSPVHFFWGSMDLACSRFSGRTAPRHPGGSPHVGDWVMEEAYSHELSSCGFSAVGGEEGAFYSYAYPEPDGFSDYPVRPGAAYYGPGEYFLPYEAVRTEADPDRVTLDFLQTTYEAAAECGGWDRAALEADPDRWKEERGQG